MTCVLLCCKFYIENYVYVTWLCGTWRPHQHCDNGWSRCINKFCLILFCLFGFNHGRLIISVGQFSLLFSNSRSTDRPIDRCPFLFHVFIRFRADKTLFVMGCWHAIDNEQSSSIKLYVCMYASMCNQAIVSILPSTPFAIRNYDFHPTLCQLIDKRWFSFL